MKLAIFGATGGTGKELVKQALAAGHQVQVLARNPAQIAPAANLTIIQGNLNDASAVADVIAGTDAVLSAVGPRRDMSATDELAVGYQNILNAMDKHQVKRLIAATGAGVPAPGDEPKFINHVISFLLKTLSRQVYEASLLMVSTIRQSALDWTIVRAPRLTDKPKTGNIRVGVVGKGTGAVLTRGDFAAFMLQQLESQQFLKAMPMISN